MAQWLYSGKCSVWWYPDPYHGGVLGIDRATVPPYPGYTHHRTTPAVPVLVSAPCCRTSSPGFFWKQWPALNTDLFKNHYHTGPPLDHHWTTLDISAFPDRVLVGFSGNLSKPLILVFFREMCQKPLILVFFRVLSVLTVSMGFGKAFLVKMPKNSLKTTDFH